VHYKAHPNNLEGAFYNENHVKCCHYGAQDLIPHRQVISISIIVDGEANRVKENYDGNKGFEPSAVRASSYFHSMSHRIQYLNGVLM